MDRGGLVFNRRDDCCRLCLLESFKNLTRFARHLTSGRLQSIHAWIKGPTGWQLVANLRVTIFDPFPSTDASLAEISRIDRADDGAVNVTDIDPRRTKEGRFLLLVWCRSTRSE